MLIGRKYVSNLKTEGSNILWNLNMNMVIWRVTRSKNFNMSVCLKSGLVCSSYLEKVINLIARFCNVKNFLY